MTSWTSEELAKIGSAEELDIASRLPDGALLPFVTIWVVRADDDLFVRSVKGERDVAFEEAGAEVHAPVTAAYHEKYDRYGPSIVGTVVSAESVTTTLRLVPR